jgi:hypothetical protein
MQQAESIVVQKAPTMAFRALFTLAGESLWVRVFFWVFRQGLELQMTPTCVVTCYREFLRACGMAAHAPAGIDCSPVPTAAFAWWV